MAPSTNPTHDVARHPGRPTREALERLLALAARGDVEAFMRFYDLTCSVAYRAAGAIHADRERAERLACSLYVRAWRNAARYPRSGLSPTAWLLADIAQAGLGCDERRAGGPAELWARGA